MQANKIIVEEEEEFTGPTLINKLEEFGISAADVKKLMEAGFQTVESITFTAKKNLITIKGLTETKIDKIMEVGKGYLKYINISSLLKQPKLFQ